MTLLSVVIFCIFESILNDYELFINNILSQLSMQQIQ